MTSRWYKYTLMLSRDGQSIERAPDGWERFSELRYGEVEPMSLPTRNDMRCNIPTPPAQRMTRREVRLRNGSMIALYIPDSVSSTGQHVRMVEKWIAEST